MLLPEQFVSTPTEMLLRLAAQGQIGLDRVLMGEIVRRLQGPEREATIDELVQFGTSGDQRYPLDISPAICDALRVARSPKAIPFFLHFLQNLGDLDQDPVYTALGELGRDAVEPLLALREAEQDPEQQMELEFLLAGLHSFDDRIAALLRARLESDPSDAAISLALYGDRAMLPVIEAKLQELKSQPDEGRTVQELEFTRRELLSERVVDEPEAVDILNDYEEFAFPVFEVMSLAEQLRFAKHPRADVRRRMLEAAQDEVEEEPTEAEKNVLLGLAQEDEDEGVRGLALQALGPHIDQDPALAPYLQKQMLDGAKSPTERVGALLGLLSGSAEPVPGTEGPLRELYEHEGIRHLVLRGMCLTLDKQYAPFMSKHLEDDDLEVVKAALLGVGVLDLGFEAGRVQKCFHTEELRESALHAYALCAPGKFNGPLAKSLLNRIEKLADGLSEEEEELVMAAIDQRLQMQGLKPYFASHHG